MRLSQTLKSLLLTALFAVAGTAAAQKTQLLVYTALETDQLKAYQEAFNKVEPNIEIKWVRDSTGVITAKLLAEKANPQADAVMGVAASSLALLDKQGMLVAFAPLNLDDARDLDGQCPVQQSLVAHQYPSITVRYSSGFPGWRPV